GYAGLLHRAPLRPRAWLVLVDPSYEVKTEYAQTAVFLRRLIAAWPQAVLLIWYPTLPAKRHLELIGGLAGVETLRREAAFDLKGGAGMTGSGLLIINAPFGAAQAVDAALAQGAPVLRPMRP
ncbi:MAG: 23S rRNA (adenine(2030)-N(6))-methyltransferase RlmJ, partial [Pseudomonadota bacterium]